MSNIILYEDIDKLNESLESFISDRYNSFDINLCELEKVFNNLKYSDLISKREYLGFINSGIKKLFKKNIADCILAYKFYSPRK